MKKTFIVAVLGLIAFGLHNLPPIKNPCAEPVNLNECLGPIAAGLGRDIHWK